jgi:hypothetical protein
MTVAASSGIWASVDRLLARAEVGGILAHKLGPLAARRLRGLGEPVPPSLAAPERAAAISMMVATPLLERVRASCDGPLVLIKGPEVAAMYPGAARTFSDLDLLTLDTDGVHRSLRSSGFIEIDDPELFVDHHHLRPLKWPALGLKVEIHSGLPWPESGRRPGLQEVVEGAGHSATGVEGISVPDPIHHALILAAHAWVHDPLGKLRDLADVAAVAAGASKHELDAVARAWGIHRVWRATDEAAAFLLAGGPLPLPVRLWARHLPLVRERTVLENHLERWLHGFSEQSAPRALLATVGVLRQELLPEAHETWRDKAIRVTDAVRHPTAPLSSHMSAWQTAARQRSDRRARRSPRAR